MRKLERSMNKERKQILRKAWYFASYFLEVRCSLSLWPLQGHWLAEVEHVMSVVDMRFLKSNVNTHKYSRITKIKSYKLCSPPASHSLNMLCLQRKWVVWTLKWIFAIYFKLANYYSFNLRFKWILSQCIMFCEHSHGQTKTAWVWYVRETLLFTSFHDFF